MPIPAYTSAGARAQGAGVTTLTPAIPAAVAEFDLLILHFGIDDGLCDLGLPAPWSTFAVRDFVGFTVRCGFYFASAGYSTAPVLTWSAAGNAFAQVFKFSDAISPQTFPNLVDNWGSGNPHDLPFDISTTADNSLVVFFDSTFGSDTPLDQPPGWTEQIDNGGANTHNTLGTKGIATAGTPAGTISVDGGVTDWHLLQFEILGSADAPASFRGISSFPNWYLRGANTPVVPIPTTFSGASSFGPYWAFRNIGGTPTPPIPPLAMPRPPERAVRFEDTERELREIIELAMLVIDND